MIFVVAFSSFFVEIKMYETHFILKKQIQGVYKKIRLDHTNVKHKMIHKTMQNIGQYDVMFFPMP